MARRMLIDASHPEETRVVVVDGTKLSEFDFETASRKPLKGNIYLAKVIRIEPSELTTVLVRCESLLIGSICLGSHGFTHPVKVDVRLVSFPLSGVRNDLASELRSAA